MSPLLYLWFAATVFSLATGRWVVVASLCWITAALFDFALITVVVTTNVPVESLPNPDLFVVLGILVITVTLALIWAQSRRGTRIVWWLCTFFAGAWICMVVWRWTQMEVGEPRALLGPVLAIVAHLLTAFAISRMWPRKIDPAYGRTFE